MVFKTFTFDAAHKLPNYEGKCKNLHGHTYKLEVSVMGDINKETGMVIDFVDLSKIVKENIIEKCDHAYLNDIFENPTAEIMAREFLKILKTCEPRVCYIRLWETPTSYVVATTQDIAERI